VKVQEGTDYPTVKGIVQECERLRYDCIWRFDHLQPVGHWASTRTAPILECWTLLSSLATITSTIRLGTMVLCNLFRSPSVLAKMGATLDVISGGRLEFGIGAGWFESECIAYGIPFGDVKSRSSQLREAVEIIKLMWTEEMPIYNGQFYQIKEPVNYPKPIQKPHPRIWIGGIGERNTLPIVSQLADGCNFLSLEPAECGRRLGILQRLCTRSGRDYSSLRRSWQGAVQILASGKISSSVDSQTSRCGSNEQVKDESQRYQIQGTPRQCIDRIQEYIDVGVTDFILIFPDVPNLNSLRLFSEEVMSTFK